MVLRQLAARDFDSGSKHNMKAQAACAIQGAMWVEFDMTPVLDLRHHDNGLLDQSSARFLDSISTIHIATAAKIRNEESRTRASTN